MPAPIRKGKRVRFVAPEILSAENPCPTEQSDIYSLSMTIYALGTGTSPLHHLHSDDAVIEGVTRGERPTPPSTLGGLDAQSTTNLYMGLAYMWRQSPADRLSAYQVEWFVKDHQADRMRSPYYQVPEASDQHHLSGTLEILRSLDWEHERDLGLDLLKSVPVASQPILIQEMLEDIRPGNEAMMRDIYPLSPCRLLSKAYSTTVIMNGFVLWTSSATTHVPLSVYSLVAKLFESVDLIRLMPDEVSEFVRRVPEPMPEPVLDHVPQHAFIPGSIMR